MNLIKKTKGYLFSEHKKDKLYSIQLFARRQLLLLDRKRVFYLSVLGILEHYYKTY